MAVVQESILNILEIIRLTPCTKGYIFYSFIYLLIFIHVC